MPINVDKYIDADSQDTPIIRYVEKNVVEKRYGVDVRDLLGPIDANGNLLYPNAGNEIDLSAITGAVPSDALSYKFYRSAAGGDVVLNASSVGFASFSHAFQSNDGINSFSMPNLVQIDFQSFQYCFVYSKIKSVVVDSLETIPSTNSGSCFTHFCDSARFLEVAKFTNLQSISGSYAFNYAFASTAIKENPFPELVSVLTNGNGAFAMAFISCRNIENFSFDKLQTILAPDVFSRAWQYCGNLKTLSFPALKAVSRESSFDNMLSGCSGVTVHFPSNLQEVIGEWFVVINGFGGTNTTVLFDLPATE